MDRPQDLHRVFSANIETEQALLGSMMLHRDAISEVLPIISRDASVQLLSSKHRRLFEILLDMYDRGDPIDLITVRDELDRHGQLEEFGGVDYIVQLAEAVPSHLHAAQYARLIADKGRTKASSKVLGLHQLAEQVDKRYQVFVSSTFRDLIDERREVMQALLEMDCIPAGMELFPAADATAWDVIKRTIDLSDYYALVIGGKYGSMDENGISYTEKEYDYARSEDKYILAFLHQNPEELPGKKVELNEQGQGRLARFREKVEKAHHCKYWVSPADLGGKVSRAMNVAIKQFPKVGWVRGDRVRTMEELEAFAALQTKVADLREQNAVYGAELERLQKVASAAATDPLARFAGALRRLEKLMDLLEVEGQIDQARSLPGSVAEVVRALYIDLETTDQRLLQQMKMTLANIVRLQGPQMDNAGLVWVNGRGAIQCARSLEPLLRRS